MTTRLPPLNALRAFEAVARCGSLTAAAEELNVVRGAVSQQIRILEEHLGVPLFERRGRQLLTTPAGKRFAEAVSAAFATIGRAAGELLPGEARQRLRLGVAAPFAACWLIPRLPRFAARAERFELDLVTIPMGQNLDADMDLDALIVGSEYRPNPEIAGTAFLADEFGPVAHPDIVDGEQLTEGPAALGRCTALSARAVPWLWDAWFHESGHDSVRFRRQLAFDDLLLVLGAARAGLGVMLAPKPLVEADLASGALVAPFGFVTRNAGYHFCCRSRDQAKARFRATLDWLVDEGRQRQNA